MSGQGTVGGERTDEPEEWSSHAETTTAATGATATGSTATGASATGASAAVGNHRWRYLVAAIVVLVVGAAAILLATRGGDAETGTIRLFAPQDRLPMRPLSGRTLEEEPLDVADLRGSVVVVNVWGSWCGPCRAEARALNRVEDATAAQGVRFVGVNRADKKVSAQAYVRRFEITYPSIQATEDTAPLVALRGFVPVNPPATLVIDRRGRVAATVAGGVTELVLRNVLEPLIAEPA